MRYSIVCAAFFSLTLIGGAFAWSDHRAKDPEFIVRTFLGANHIKGAVLAYGEAGKPPTVKAFGNLDANMLLPMASLTKSVTAETVMRLIDQNRLSLDTRVGDVVAVENPTLAAVTVRQLLQHEGGFDHNEKRCQRAEHQEISVGIPSYANRNYCWLGRIAEQVTGVPFAHLASETMHGNAVLTSPDFEAAAGLSADARTIYGFFGRHPHPTDLPTVRVAPDLPFYRAGWMVFPDGSTGHFGNLGGGDGSLAVASHSSDGKVFVLILNKRPRNPRLVYRSLQAQLAAALRD